MDQSLSLLNLPAEDQVELLASLRQKLNSALSTRSTIEKQLVILQASHSALTDRIERYNAFLNHIPDDLASAAPQVSSIIPSVIGESAPVESPEAITESGSSSDSLPVPYDVTQPKSIGGDYDRTASQYDKLLYIISNPEKYGRHSFVGAKSVIEAMRQEEPEMKKESDDVLMKRIGPALSHMAKTGRLVKLSERKRRLQVHYLSPQRFENNTLKPEYEEALRQYDLVPVTGRQPNSSQELPLAASEQPHSNKHDTLEASESLDSQLEDDSQTKTAPADEAEAE
jgi:hypothetical protein